MVLTGGIVELLALTGQRREEVAQLTWDEVDMTSRTWTLPASRSSAPSPTSSTLIWSSVCSMPIGRTTASIPPSYLSIRPSRLEHRQADTLPRRGCNRAGWTRCEPRSSRIGASVFVAAAYAHPTVGRKDDARKIVKTILSRDPEFSISKKVARYPYKTKELADRYVNALRQAGTARVTQLGVNAQMAPH